MQEITCPSAEGRAEENRSPWTRSELPGCRLAHPSPRRRMLPHLGDGALTESQLLARILVPENSEYFEHNYQRFEFCLNFSCGTWDHLIHGHPRIMFSNCGQQTKHA
jgi:hypothetical protein